MPEVVSPALRRLSITASYGSLVLTIVNGTSRKKMWEKKKIRTRTKRRRLQRRLPKLANGADGDRGSQSRLDVGDAAESSKVSVGTYQVYSRSYLVPVQYM